MCEGYIVMWWNLHHFSKWLPTAILDFYVYSKQAQYLSSEIIKNIIVRWHKPSYFISAIRLLILKKSRWPPNAHFRYLVSMLKQLISYYSTNVSFGKNVPKDHAYIKICSNLRIKFQNSRWLPAAILDALYTSIYSGWFCV